MLLLISTGVSPPRATLPLPHFTDEMVRGAFPVRLVMVGPADAEGRAFPADFQLAADRFLSAP